MALWVCRKCGCEFAVGMSMCPQCTSTDHEEAGMPKSTVNSGVSNADAEPGQPGYIPHDEDAEAVDVDGDGQITGYEAWSKDDLVTELEERGLPKSGNKPELIDRLEQDDLAKAADTETVEVEAEPGADENAAEGA